MSFKNDKYRQTQPVGARIARPTHDMDIARPTHNVGARQRASCQLAISKKGMI